MSSTEQDERLARFWDEKIVPLAEKLRSEGTAAMCLAPDDDAPSWYVPYPADAADLVELDPDWVADGLHALWRARETRWLDGLAEPLAELSQELYRESDRDDDDVSPFMYMMF